MNKALYIKKNVGPVDQYIRITLGVALVTVPAFLEWSAWTIAALAAFGGAQIIEGIIAY
ncbi:MAG TPA: DUF2892 domain-containing protein [Desulfotomaculum sp.]|nr:DUF2892 domain-containing protein [Desulfotomaculum sp.]